MNHAYLSLKDVRLHVVEYGDRNHPLVLLLHGFPEGWRCWESLIQPLGDAGYFVVAPDLRGYNLSDKPIGIEAYRMDRLIEDVLGILDHYKRRPAYLISHDWGGALGWQVAQRHPERIEKLVVINCPHPKPFAKALKHNRRQQKKSWYMMFFQLPMIPELVLRANHYHLFKKLLGWTQAPFLSRKDLRHYEDAWNQPRAHFHDSLVSSRSKISRRSDRCVMPQITVPVKIVWGKNDRYMESELAQASLAMCTNGELMTLEGVSHWVPRERSAELFGIITQFLAAP